MPTSGFVKALGEICAELHAGDQQDRVRGVLRDLAGETVEGTTDQSLRRFEEGQHQPRELGLIVYGYSETFGVSVPTLLRRAADRLEKNPARFEAALAEPAQARRTTMRGRAAAGRAKPKT